MDLGAGESVPGAVPGGQTFLGARQLGLRFDRGHIAPLAEGLDHFGVLEQRQLGKAQAVLHRPALDDHVFTFGLAAEVIQELAGCVYVCIALLYRGGGHGVEAHITDSRV